MGKIETTPLHSTKHGDLRVFKLKNISRPEIWAHASLVAPGLHVTECSSKEAAQFYCHLCDDVFPHDSTRLQNLHRHMKSKHLNEIQQVGPYRFAYADSPHGAPKRKASTSSEMDDPSKRMHHVHPRGHEMHGGGSHPALPSATIVAAVPPPSSSSATTSGPIHSTLFHSRKHGPISLFKVKHINRPEIWMYVSLVAPSDVVPSSSAVGWTSRDASHFYCHLCDDCFPHDYVRSQNLHRHVKNKHRADVESYMKKLIKTSDKLKQASSSASDKAAPLVSLAVDPKQSKQCELLLADWLATSSRPLALVDDPLFRKFIHAIQHTKGEFVLPTRAALDTHVDDLVLTRRTTIAAALADSCVSFSLSAHVQRLDDSLHLAWTLHYLTPAFAWTHVPLAFTPLPSDRPSSADWLTRSLSSLLHDWHLSLQHLALVTSDMAHLHDLPVRTMPCLGRVFDAVLGHLLGPLPPSPDDLYRANPLAPHASMLATTHAVFVPLVQRLEALRQAFAGAPSAKRALDRFVQLQSGQPPLAVDCPQPWQPVYMLLHSWHHMRAGLEAYRSHHDPSPPATMIDLTLSAADWCLLDGLLFLLEPCLQVAAMLTSPHAMKPTPVVLSVLKLLVTDLGSADFFGARGLLAKYQHIVQLDHAVRPLHAARTLLHTVLATFLDDVALQWTTALHPSLAATSMAQASEAEKMQVKQRLVLECPPSSATGNKYMQQALGTSGTSSDSGVQVDHELQTYFLSVAGGIDDPLAWWRAHQASFPRLATLARKWLSMWPTAQFESLTAAPRSATIPPPEGGPRLAFLRATAPAVAAAETFIV
ncbi:Aste57867_787 [Aphanomyces stellatus]|uniref:Aste57867_787 protein n=1 Tax=Aphanomyces stellatus TaxID=120398 RepID=A0A485K660_9STRA|nr:hypothetical protein As57867_000786 [Aphanomyces stellatus]VFT78011.1 Aste57867_787 [Aphanomyces stellatus]